jgi:hypothetical protein
VAAAPPPPAAVPASPRFGNPSPHSIHPHYPISPAPACSSLLLLLRVRRPPLLVDFGLLVWKLRSGNGASILAGWAWVVDFFWGLIW